MATAPSALWSSRLAFVLAATGSAVGLGNIWKFPYVAGESGGGAFVLVYLFCVAVIGLPLMMAEILMGRRGRQNPADSFRDLARESGARSWWWMVGAMGIVTGILILSFYSVIAGWAIAYVPQALMGDFVGLNAEQVGGIFTALVADPKQLAFWHSLFLLVTIGIVAGGVEAGLEKAVKYLMPALLGILLILFGYSAASGYMGDAMSFMFTPDFSKLSPSIVLSAVGMAFFSLSLGMGAIMMYGAYLPAGASIPRLALAVVIADTSVAILAGLAIFPIVFGNGLEAGGGPGLVFMTLPLAFGQMTGGAVLGTLFFTLLVVAALTSAISLLEPCVSWLMRHSNMSRRLAAITTGIVVWLLGFATIFSFNIWADFKPLLDKTLFDLVDGLTSNILLPLGGLLLAVFVSRFVSRKVLGDELGWPPSFKFRLWHFLLRYVVRVGIILVFLNATGLLPKALGLIGINW